MSSFLHSSMIPFTLYLLGMQSTYLPTYLEHDRQVTALRDLRSLTETRPALSPTACEALIGCQSDWTD